MTHPDWWQFALLALAAYRVYRLIARDTITEPLRAAASYPDDEAVTLGGSEVRLHPIGRYPDAREDAKNLLVSGDVEQPKDWRVYVATLIRCPWCAGFYVSCGWWAGWIIWPRAALFAATPWALSAVLGLVKKSLDP